MFSEECMRADRDSRQNICEKESEGIEWAWGPMMEGGKIHPPSMSQNGKDEPQDKQLSHLLGEIELLRDDG